MYKIEQTNYGIKMTFSGVMSKGEAQQFLTEFLQTIMEYDKPHLAGIADVREFVPVIPEVLKIMHDTINAGTSLFRGSVRIAVIMNSPVIKNIVTRLGHDTGTFAYFRFISASEMKDPEKAAYNWAVDGIEPVATIVPIVPEYQIEYSR
jgi:hypothetical protein